MSHKKPEQRAALWLAVNAGSVLEDEDQRGLAHFVEHMAFNGTRRFAKQEIIDYIEKIGMRFGPDVNAYTSFDQTVYMLTVPTDDRKMMRTGLDILRDWAGDVSFEPVEVEKERGVVIEEWRLGRGAFARINDKQWPVMLQGSKCRPDMLSRSANVVRAKRRLCTGLRVCHQVILRPIRGERARSRRRCAVLARPAEQNLSGVDPKVVQRSSMLRHDAGRDSCGLT